MPRRAVVLREFFTAAWSPRMRGNPIPGAAVLGSRPAPVRSGAATECSGRRSRNFWFPSRVEARQSVVLKAHAYDVRPPGTGHSGTLLASASRYVIVSWWPQSRTPD